MTTSFDAVVLAGGAARRLGGTDKAALAVGGRMLLDRVLAACAGADRTVVVGPRRPTARPVRWTREQPSGGGPLPALAAGLADLSGADLSGADLSGADLSGADPSRADLSGADRPAVVVVLAADLPFLTAQTVAALAEAVTGRWEGCLLTDAAGRDQPLAAAYLAEPLRRESALLRTEHGTLSGLPMRLLTRELTLRRIADPTGEAGFDCDTWEDVAAARARLGDSPAP